MHRNIPSYSSVSMVSYISSMLFPLFYPLTLQLAHPVKAEVSMGKV